MVLLERLTRGSSYIHIYFTQIQEKGGESGRRYNGDGDWLTLLVGLGCIRMMQGRTMRMLMASGWLLTRRGTSWMRTGGRTRSRACQGCAASPCLDEASQPSLGDCSSLTTIIDLLSAYFRPDTLPIVTESAPYRMQPAGRARYATSLICMFVYLYGLRINEEAQMSPLPQASACADASTAAAAQSSPWSID
jgi:hypothetical protein